MGGTYWYYVSHHRLGVNLAAAHFMQYRFNGDVDHHDPAKPSTTLCPSLPGQTVNILEMPVQADEQELLTPNGSTTSLDSFVFTLDPKDKYLPLGVRRAATTSAIKKRKARRHDTAGIDANCWPKQRGRAEVQVQTTSSTEVEGSPSPRQRSVHSIFHKLRRIKSAESNLKSTSALRTGTSWSRKLLSRTGQSRKGKAADDDVPVIPRLPTNVLSIAPIKPLRRSPSPMQASAAPRLPDEFSATGIISPGQAISIPSPEQPSVDHLRSELTPSPAEDYGPDRRPKSSRGSNGSRLGSFFFPRELNQMPDTCSYDVESTGKSNLEPGHFKLELPRIPDIENETTGSVARQSKNGAGSVDTPISQQDSTHDAEDSSCLYAESPSFSYATSDVFSPCVGTNTTASGNMSPIQLSQPDTPQLSDFNDDAVAWRQGSDPDIESAYSIHQADQLWGRPPSTAPPPPPISRGNEPSALWPGLGGFQGYSLPLHDQASAVTIKKLPSLDFKSGDHVSEGRTSNQHQIQSWDDGSGHRMSALKGLVDDLGYLGGFIN